MPALEQSLRRHEFTCRRWQDQWTPGSVVFRSPDERDHHTRLSVAYRHTAQWSASVGGNVFNDREPQTFYGRFEGKQQPVCPGSLYLLT